MFIPDPNFSIPDPGSKRSRIRIYIKRIRVFLTSKKLLLSFGNSIWDDHPGSGFFFIRDPGSPDAGAKKASDPGSISGFATLDSRPGHA
jgi:hypothetical protein